MPKIIKHSPSKFAFLYAQCKRCYMLDTVYDIKRPSQPMPQIFNSIDKQMKSAFKGVLLSELDTSLPRMRIIDAGHDDFKYTVTSKTIEYPDINLMQYIYGKIDSLAVIEDENGNEDGYAVIDFKTSDITKHMPKYSRQLHSYAYALENPKRGTEVLGKSIVVKRLGLLIYDPSEGPFVINNGLGNLSGKLIWEEIPYNPAEFKDFLDKLAVRLANPKLPEADKECPYCKRDRLMAEFISTQNQENEKELVA